MDALTLREFLTRVFNVGYGSGSGYGSGDGDGYGDGDGSGSGYGSGDGDGYGDGSGDGYGYGDGDGSGSGYGDGDGSGYGDGSGDGYGYGYGSGDGYGSGYGDGSGDGYGIKSVCGMAVHMIDGVPTIITQLRGSVAKGFVLRGDMGLEPTYVVKGTGCFSHGRTLHEAREALLAKMFEDMPEEDRLDAFCAEFKPGEARTVAEFYDWHHRLTGSCTQGRDAFALDHGLKMDDAMTPEEFIRLTCDAYGGAIIRKLAGRYNVEL